MNRTSTGLALACGLFVWSQGWLEGPRAWIAAHTLAPQERKAVELQCRSLPGTLRSSCEQETAESLVAGEFDPEHILRVHCTRFDNLWADDLVEIPPDLCIERYGGWLSS